jgi:hypothetical protein
VALLLPRFLDYPSNITGLLHVPAVRAVGQASAAVRWGKHGGSSFHKKPGRSGDVPTRLCRCWTHDTLLSNDIVVYSFPVSLVIGYGSSKRDEGFDLVSARDPYNRPSSRILLEVECLNFVSIVVDVLYPQTGFRIAGLLCY